jgi:hypothetical protein
VELCKFLCRMSLKFVSELNKPEGPMELIELIVCMLHVSYTRFLLRAQNCIEKFRPAGKQFALQIFKTVVSRLYQAPLYQ